MPTYVYKARDTAGNPVKGTLEAGSKPELADKLHRLGYLPTQVSEASPTLKIESVLDRIQRISTEDMVMFNVQLSNLIHAGVSILSSLGALSQQIENKKLRATVGMVSRNVESGSSFSEALQETPKIFPKLFVSMIKAGEASGKLDTILTRYANYCEAQAELRQKIKGALFYPIILLFAGIAVTLFIVTFVIPQFAEIFMKVGIHLPLPTLILYQVGIGIKQFWYSLLLFAVVAWLAVRYYADTPTGKLHMDRLGLRLPIIGGINRKAAISRFARTLGMLIGSGVPILQSLDMVREVVGNEVLVRVIQNAYSAVEKGEKISSPLRVSNEFPPDTVQMISVGEETGSLDEMLEKISDFYDRSVDYSVKKLTTVFEPLLLVIMGCLVGFIMASMLLPMFDMVKILRNARAGF